MNVILSIPSTDPLNLQPPPEYKFNPGLKKFPSNTPIIDRDDGGGQW